MQSFVKRRVVGGPIHPRAIYCDRAGKKGVGVFAGRAFKTGDSIEECEVIFLPKKEVKILQKTQINCYYYCWKGGAGVLPLGFGVLYNHSSNPNAEWEDDYALRRMMLTARHPIKKGEEITVNYGLKPEEMWFTPVD